MALNVTPTAQLVFFETVFGNSQTTVMVKDLIHQGMSFETNLYTIKASHHGATYQQKLTTGTSALMKGTLPLHVKQQNKTLITNWVEELHMKLVPLESVLSGTPPVEPIPAVKPLATGGDPLEVPPSMYLITLMEAPTAIIPVVKVIRELTGWGLKQAKEMAEAARDGQKPSIGPMVGLGVKQAVYKLAQVGVLSYVFDSVGNVADVDKLPEFYVATIPAAPVTESKPKPSPLVMALRDAQALGQKVRGTSPGSVYHTVAVSSFVRLAARIHKGGSISIRAEWTGTPSGDIQRLADAGMQMKVNYGSMHLDAQGLPPAKIIGGFVIGTGIPWTDILISANDYVVEP